MRLVPTSNPAMMTEKAVCKKLMTIMISGGSRKSSRGVLLVIIARENFCHAHIIAANEIETTEQPKISMEIDFLSQQTGFFSQIL